LAFAPTPVLSVTSNSSTTESSSNFSGCSSPTAIAVCNSTRNFAIASANGTSAIHPPPEPI
jgi:hypothetical protein